MAATHCKFYQFGHCRYGEHCRNRHVIELCKDENCHISICLKRHPKECRFFHVYRRCKFGDYCNYLHLEDATDSHACNDHLVKGFIEQVEALESENKKLIIKVDKLEAKYVERRKKIMAKRLLEVEAVLIDDSDEDTPEDDEEEENVSLKEELKNLISESEQRRENWEKLTLLSPDETSLATNSLEDNGLA